MVIKVGDKEVSILHIARGMDEERTDVSEIHLDGVLTAKDLALFCEKDWEFDDGHIEAGPHPVIKSSYLFRAPVQSSREIYLETQLASLARERDAAKMDATASIEELLQSARSGLLSPPEPGEEWDKNKWYRSNDTVTRRGVTYRCTVTCKGKQPDTDIDRWEVVPEEAPEVLIWTDMPKGITVEVGTLVSHNDTIWQCIKMHAKSLVRQPSAVQTDYWEVYNGG